MTTTTDPIDILQAALQQQCAPAQAPTPPNVTAILTQRGQRYGKFEDTARVIVQLKQAYTARIAERGITLADDQLEALDMICHKIGRIVNGDPNYADSWVDIAGYAQLVADRLEGVAR